MVRARYPVLADKLVLSWELGLDVFAERIAARFDRSAAGDWHCVHPQGASSAANRRGSRSNNHAADVV
jgi:hypothetical protein